ncbi:MAG: hypothetical protein DMF62_04955 [Acidobacteria bacterium]|nr:MAG: hypothetical protein DMF62_04955 [Acidobacteriota bacterium]
MRSKFMVSFSVEMEISHADGLNHSPNSGIPDNIMAELSDYAFDAVAAGDTTLKSYQGSDGSVWYIRALNNGEMSTEVTLVPRVDRER